MSAVARIPKPNMNFNQSKRLYKHIYIALAFSGLCGYAAQKLMIEPYEKKIDDYFLTYNPWEDFERMRKLGLFQSCPPDEVLQEREAKKKQKK